MAVPGGSRLPGLVVAWRRDGDGWQAQVALVRDDAVLLRWVSATDLRPVTDDRWGLPGRRSGGEPRPATTARSDAVRLVRGRATPAKQSAASVTLAVGALSCAHPFVEGDRA